MLREAKAFEFGVLLALVYSSISAGQETYARKGTDGNTSYN